MGKKVFKYGERVRVKLPGRRAFFGVVYSQYCMGLKRERFICVMTPTGSGVAYLVRYVTHAKKKRKT